MSEWSKLAITGLSTMLFTGLISWFAFGAGTLTITQHEKPAAHSQQNRWNMNQEKWNAMMNMRVKSLEKLINQLPNNIAEKVVFELNRREDNSGR